MSRCRNPHRSLRALRSGDQGQVIVLLAGGLSGLLLVVGLVLDGGNAWAHQRIVQNGSDAAAEAGAAVMAARLAGAAEPAGGWDAKVDHEVRANAAANDVTVQAAYYTDICGIPLDTRGNASLNADGTQDLAGADVVG